ncbi:MAG: hypothetical protein ACR2PM_03705 [Hyphomicrobiales bacterium]
MHTYAAAVLLALGIAAAAATGMSTPNAAASTGVATPQSPQDAAVYDQKKKKKKKEKKRRGSFFG